MKEFLRTCLEELELKTGIRQVYWLNQQCETQEQFDKKKNILLDSMVLVCKEFEYIPEDAQKSIVSNQIIKDQDYDALNARTLWKWFKLFSGPYMNPPEVQKKEIVYPDISPETQKMIDDLKNKLVGGPMFDMRLVEDDMKKIQKEDKERVDHKSLSVHYRPDLVTAVMSDLKIKYSQECRHPHTGDLLPGKPEFSIWLEQRAEKETTQL